MEYICASCNKTITPGINVFRCECGGMLMLGQAPPAFDPALTDTSCWSQMRYRHTIPVDDNLLMRVTMGEGMTPVVKLSAGYPGLYVKADYLMPTLSFKDRGAAVVIAKALEMGVEKVVQDSSGNAGNSIAAYCARVGIECEIFVPEGTAVNKINMIKAHGAAVTIVPGSREDTAAAALKGACSPGVYYASHVYSPYFTQGTKTYVYEVFEQLQGNLPDVWFIPTGNGTLLLGCIQGLNDLYSSGLIERMPRVIAVQSQNCCPLYHEFKGLTPPEKNEPTKAEGIAIADPKRASLMLDSIRDIGGDIILAPECNIDDAKNELALNGYYVEPTTAATFAAYKEYAGSHPDISMKTVLLPLCGAGLKKG